MIDQYRLERYLEHSDHDTKVYTDSDDEFIVYVEVCLDCLENIGLDYQARCIPRSSLT